MKLYFHKFRLITVQVLFFLEPPLDFLPRVYNDIYSISLTYCHLPNWLSVRCLWFHVQIFCEKWVLHVCIVYIVINRVFLFFKSIFPAILLKPFLFFTDKFSQRFCKTWSACMQFTDTCVQYCSWLSYLKQIHFMFVIVPPTSEWAV